VRGTPNWAALLLSPLRFWLGAGAFLLIVAGMSYGYGSWYAGVLLKDAAAVREVRANSSWTAQFQYEEIDGVRRRVDLPGPERLSADIALDELASADAENAGYSSYGAVLRELGSTDEEDEKNKDEQTGAISREELLRNLRMTGIMLNETDTRSWKETVGVGEGLTADEARAKAEEFRRTGRDVEVETYQDPSGETRYRLNYGRVRTPEEAAALRKELESEGLLGGGSHGGAHTDGGSGGTEPSGGGTTAPTGGNGNGGSTAPTGGNGGGPGPGGTTAPPTGSTSPPGGQPGSGRAVGDL
jgi:hypothetical protein